MHRNICSLLVAALATLPAAAQSAYTVVELGILPGYNSVTANAINDAGQVAGTLQVLPAGASTAFLWQRGAGFQALGKFNGTGTVGTGINNAGDIAGYAVGSVYNPGPAFLWSRAGGFRRLDPPAGSSGSTAFAVNDARQVAGNVLGPRPVRWEASAQGSLLGSLGGVMGAAHAINRSGQVTGYSRNSKGYPRPYLWDPATGMRDLGTFESVPASGGVAYGINDLGHVVGNADAGSFSRAFLWRDGQLTAIGPDGSFAYGVNALDHVVGQFLTGGSYRAFIYRGGAIADLNRLIPSGSGIVLSVARAINSSGWIVANGKDREGRTRAFLLIPR